MLLQCSLSVHMLESGMVIYDALMMMDAHTTDFIITPENEVGGGGFTVYRNHPVCLFVCLSKVNLNFGYIFSSKRDKASILHMYVPCDEIFRSV